jgi:hypothetical protein
VKNAFDTKDDALNPEQFELFEFKLYFPDYQVHYYGQRKREHALSPKPLPLVLIYKYMVEKAVTAFIM